MQARGGFLSVPARLLRPGFIRALQLVLRLKGGALLHAGPHVPAGSGFQEGARKGHGPIH